MLEAFVLENCNAPGNGAVTPAGAPTGFRTFATAFPGTGVKAWYVLTDGVVREEGWTIVDTHLVRNVVWRSDVGLTSTPYNFTATCQIYNNTPAQRTLWADDSNVFQSGARRYANAAKATLTTDLARLDQLGWERIGAAVSLSSVNANVSALPSGFLMLRLNWLVSSSAGAGVLYAQFSINGGTSFDNTNHYAYSYRDTASGADVNGTGSFIPLNNNRSGAQSDLGCLELSASGTVGGMTNTFLGASFAWQTGGFYYSGGAATHILFAINAGTFASGTVWLEGKRA